MKAGGLNIRGFPLSRIALLSLAAGLIYAQFHLFGNTTEVQGFGRSAFNWMLTLWKSERIFGGNTYYLGWIMPVLSMGLIYLRRREIAAATRTVCWPGLLLVATAQLLHWAGARAQQTRLSLIALILLLWSISLFLYGWPLARHLVFPIGMLIFCVPLNFLDALTFPMRIISAQFASVLLNGAGLETTRSGSVILGAPPTSYAIDGADPASGLGTLLTLMALTIVAGYLVHDGLLLRLFLMAMVVPTMILAGSLRLVGSAVMVEIIGPAAAQVVHSRGGTLLMLALSVAVLAAMRSAWIRVARRRPS